MARLLRSKQKYLARERVKHLFGLAEQCFHSYPERSDHYVDLARKVAMKARVRIPRELKKRFCKHCYCFLQPGVNCRVRTRGDKIVYYCLACKKHMRFPFVKEKNSRKKVS